jgi:RNA polymerase sigma-70 factor (ECF subfamily)
VITGAREIVRVLAGFARVGRRRGATVEIVEVNGGPGLLAFDGGRLVAVWTFEFSGDAVRVIRGVTNPDKIAHISSTILPSLPPALKRS